MKPPGEVAEWLKAQHWKCCLGVTLTRVRIPPSPFLAITIGKYQDGIVTHLSLLAVSSTLTREPKSFVR